ncbi:MAG TPA: hypothetical protein ENI23_13600, partial [bacterium]|nr:hypothetical protein [bacterium]
MIKNNPTGNHTYGIKNFKSMSKDNLKEWIDQKPDDIPVIEWMKEFQKERGALQKKPEGMSGREWIDLQLNKSPGNSQKKKKDGSSKMLKGKKLTDEMKNARSAVAIIPKMIYAGQITFIFAAQNTGKSLLGFELGVAIAQGAAVGKNPWYEIT